MEFLASLLGSHSQGNQIDTLKLGFTEVTGKNSHKLGYTLEIK